MSDLHIRIDETVEAEATQVLAEMGLTVEQLVQGVLKRVAEEKRLPLTPNPETVSALQAAQRGELVRFDSVEALMADLNADD